MHESAANAADLHYLDAALSLGTAAGELLRAGAAATGGRPALEYKGVVTDLVTQYDRAAEELIVSGLRARFPQHRILAEEGGDHGGDPAAPRWIIDPLDGTTNFAHGLPIFSVSIGCEVAGEMRVGVIVAPLLGLTFTAVRGAGAAMNGQPLKTSAVSALERALLTTGFPYDRHTSPDNNFAQFIAFKKRAQGVRRLGSAAIDLSFVARGIFDGYWEMKLKPWDIAAGMLLVEEAGGKVSDWRGAPISLQRGELLASNGPLHAAMCEVLAATLGPDAPPSR